eukprot:TRINITY_DN8197_c0_g3_i1.p1 TRINITY_DN8197_c0_g3~~TRINITY_DN8197_c0_g3_i1.p1  ORF type:complete len:118 (-),score=15.03 TRINITY_DN8197_c0_g3_i1:210-563(-)
MESGKEELVIPRQMLYCKHFLQSFAEVASHPAALSQVFAVKPSFRKPSSGRSFKNLSSGECAVRLKKCSRVTNSPKSLGVLEAESGFRTLSCSKLMTVRSENKVKISENHLCGRPLL